MVLIAERAGASLINSAPFGMMFIQGDFGVEVSRSQVQCWMSSAICSWALTDS